MNDDILKKEHPELYRVAREGGTEPAFTGEYVHTKEDGMYHCAVCGVPLFSSETKFDSGSGWPSFTDPAVASAVKLLDDDSHGKSRMEVRCANCDAHLGHVFPDGPKKNGNVCDRYCINSVSLDLRNNDTDKKSGDGGYVASSNTTDNDQSSSGFFDGLFGGGDGDGGGDGGGGD
jgi:peptide-methionine (R)-S-oxide reductase